MNNVVLSVMLTEAATGWVIKWGLHTGGNGSSWRGLGGFLEEVCRG